MKSVDVETVLMLEHEALRLYLELEARGIEG